MNLDLITKLARLANNNPNDNEANLAARRACKLIEEGKFQFGLDTSKIVNKPTPNVRPQPEWYTNPFDAFNSYYTQQKQRTASEYAQQQARQQQQQYTQEPPGRCKKCGAALDYLDILTNGRICNNCKLKDTNKSVKWEYGFNEASTKSKSHEKIDVKCLFCKKDFKRSSFTSDFVCHQCYVKKNKSEKPPVKDERTRTYYKAVFCFACGHGFTVTYTDITNDSVGQVVGKCPQCKASYIRATR